MFPRVAAVVLCLALFAGLAFGQNPDAVVRVTNSNGLGSGTVFFVSDSGDAYVLTNHHVAGRKGNRVAVEFWHDGELMAKKPGNVVAAAINGGYLDVAIVRVSKAELGDWKPAVIPLASEATKIPENTVIRSRGCPGGVWACEFVGRTYKATDERMEFFPRPGGGRSGSAIVSDGKNEICGLLTWSANKPSYEQHGTDGTSPKSGNGVAQQIANVWSVINGEASSLQESRPSELVPLIYPLPEDPQIGQRFFRRRHNPPAAPPSEMQEFSEGLKDELGKMLDSPSEPQPEDESIGTLLRRSQPGPIRRGLSAIFTMFKLIVLALAVYGAWCAFRKVKSLLAPVSVLLLAGLLTGSVAAQDGYAAKLQPHADRWQLDVAASPDAFGTYEMAYSRATEDHRPILTIVTTANCAPCISLKPMLLAMDQFGLLNDTHTATVDADESPNLAGKLTDDSEAFPVLVVQAYNPATEKWTRTIRVGGFDSQTSLEKWCRDLGLK